MILKPKKYLIIVRGDYIEIKKVKRTYSEFIETVDGECYPLNALTYKLSHFQLSFDCFYSLSHVVECFVKFISFNYLLIASLGG